MEKQSKIAITLGVSIALLAIAASFLPLQQLASAQPAPSNPAGSNMTGPAANTTGGSGANIWPPKASTP
jgi:hypothetical protein